MGIVREFIIKDIIQYELYNDINIIEQLQHGSLSVIYDLIKLGNKKEDGTCMNDSELQIYFNRVLSENSLETIVEDIVYTLVGKPSSDDKDEINTKEFKSFSDILEFFYSQIQVIDKNMSFSEFQNISTRYMYRYAAGLKDRYIREINSQSQKAFLEAKTLLGLMFGKIKKPLDFSDKLNDSNNESAGSKADIIRNKLKASGYNIK